MPISSTTSGHTSLLACCTRVGASCTVIHSTIRVLQPAVRRAVLWGATARLATQLMKTVHIILILRTSPWPSRSSLVSPHNRDLLASKDAATRSSKSTYDSASNLNPHHSASRIALDDVSECLRLQYQAARKITHCHARLKPTQTALL